MKRLENKTVVITGGAGGIGSATAKRMIGTANVLPYVASNYANNGMMRSAALEGAPHKIRAIPLTLRLLTTA